MKQWKSLPITAYTISLKVTFIECQKQSTERLHQTCPTIDHESWNVIKVKKDFEADLVYEVNVTNTLDSQSNKQRLLMKVEH